MTEDEVKAAIDLATKGLSDKNAQLLKELKDARKASSQFEGLDLAALKTAADELSKLKADKLEADGEYKKMYEQQKSDHSTMLEKLSGANKELTNKLIDTTKANALTNALVGNNVIPELVDVAMRTLKDQVAVGDDGIPVVGDKAVSDFVKDWAASPVGKHFVKSGNSGGGGNGNDGGSVDSNAKYFDKKSPDYNLTKQAQLATADPTAYAALKK